LGAGDERCFATLTAPVLSCERRVTGEGPPVNLREQLKGDRVGQWSLRVNDQFRICSRWTGSDAEEVEIVDYH
jgi:plasmid maintenance system killer protein